MPWRVLTVQTLLDHMVHESTSFPRSVPEVGLDLREPVQGAREVPHLLRVALVLDQAKEPTLNIFHRRPLAGGILAKIKDAHTSSYRQSIALAQDKQRQKTAHS